MTDTLYNAGEPADGWTMSAWPTPPGRRRRGRVLLITLLVATPLVLILVVGAASALAGTGAAGLCGGG